MQVFNVTPVIGYWGARHFVQIGLALWYGTGMRLNDYSARVRIFHAIFRPTPDAANAKKFVSEIWSILIRISEVAKTIAPTIWINMTIELLHVFRVMGDMKRIERPIITFCIAKQNISAVGKVSRGVALRL